MISLLSAVCSLLQVIVASRPTQSSQSVKSSQLAGGRCEIQSQKAPENDNNHQRSPDLSLFFTMKDLMTNLFSWDLDFFLQSVFLR